MLYEKEVSGFYFSGNLLDNYSNNEKSLRAVSIQRVLKSFDKTDGEELTEGTHEFADRQRITVCGMITKTVDKSTRKGDKMRFVTVEDRNAQIELIVFPKTLDEYGYMLTQGNIIGAYGEISSKGGDNEVKLILQKLTVLKSNEEYVEQISPVVDQAKTEPPKEKTLYLRVDKRGSTLFKKAMNLVEIFEGKTKVIFYDSEQKQYIAVNGIGIDLSEKTVSFFKELLGEQNVILK